MRLVLKQGVTLAVAGSNLGVTGAFFLHKVMASFLYGLSRNDPFILPVSGERFLIRKRRAPMNDLP
jgi:hypothetical protein